MSKKKNNTREQKDLTEDQQGSGKNASPLDLPENVYQLIFEQLGLDDSSKLAKASKKTSEAARKSELWRKRLELEFPHHYQKIKRKIKARKRLNFEELYKEAYEQDYKNLSRSQQKLFSCVKRGDIETLRRYLPLDEQKKPILERGENFFCYDLHGYNLISWAIHYEHDQILQHLADYLNIKKIESKTHILPKIYLGEGQEHTDFESILNIMFHSLHLNLSDYQIVHVAVAAYYGNLTVLKEILENISTTQENLNKQQYEALIYFAILCGHTDCVKLLLEKGSKFNYQLNHTNKIQTNPLHLAILQNEIEIAKLLIDTGIDLDSIINSRFVFLPPNDGNLGIKAIHLAAKLNCYDIVKYLIEKNPALVHQKDDADRTPLIWASEMGHTDIVQLLLEHDAKIDHQPIIKELPWGDRWEYSALQRAVHYNHTETALLLIQSGADISATSRGNDTLLDSAIRNSNLTLVITLIEANPDLIKIKNTETMRLLKIAIKQDCYDIVKYLIEKDPSVVTQRAYYGEAPLRLASRMGRTDIVQLLLEHGANINDKSKPERYAGYGSALQEAVDHNKTETALTLINQGAKTSDVYFWGDDTLLHRAIKRGNQKIVRALIQANPDLLNETNYDHETPLEMSARLGNFTIEKILISAGAILQEDSKKYKPRTYFWAEDIKCRDLLKLRNKQKKYDQHKSKELRAFGITFRYSSADKLSAINHLLSDTLNGPDSHELTEKDKDLLKRSPELRLIYKHLSKP